MTALPSWCQSKEARALIQAILAEQPESRIENHSANLGGMVEVYEGRNAMLLRGLHDRALGEACAAADAAYATGMSWDQAAVELMALHRAEKPDALIGRLLNGVERSVAA